MSGVRIHGLWSFLIGAAVLGIANTIVKPILTLLTLPIVIPYSALYARDQHQMLAPPSGRRRISRSTASNYLGAVVIIWLVNWVAHASIDRAEGLRRSLTAC